MATDNFPYVIPLILKAEGGYVNDPSDPGGETKYGISKKSYPSVDIANLTVQGAQDIYKRDFWLANHLDGITDKENAHIAMDTVVNHGSGEGGKLIQRAVNAAGGNIGVDGAIGPQTVAAINAAQPAQFQQSLHDIRASFYQTLVQSGKASAKFLTGWLSRISKWNTGAVMGGAGGIAMVAVGLAAAWYFFFRKRGRK